MNCPSKWLKGVLAAVVLLAFATTGYAQDASTGSISGTVTDSTGALVRGAQVTIVNTDRGATERTLATNGSGFYTATALPLGHYRVKITGKGFKAESVTGIQLHVNDALTVNGALTVGNEGESVQVTAESQSVDLQDATSAGLINSTQINELVMISRNYETLINLQPGVAFSGTTDQLQRGPVGINGSSSTTAFSISGGRTTSNNWTIDGADNLDRGSNLTLYVYPSPDAIAEFKTLRGEYSAASGRDAAGQIDVVTKSGTNTIHGSAYEYFRNDFLDANTYGNDALNAIAGSTKYPIAKYRYNDFGFSLGGPVILPHLYNGRDKTFWFVSENWLREITYTPASSTAAIVPTPAEVAGDFSNEWYKNTAGAWVQGPVNVCTAFTNNSTNQTNTCTAQGTSITGAQAVTTGTGTMSYTGVSPTAAAYLKDIYSTIPENTPAQQAAYAAEGLDPRSLYSTTIRNEYPNLDSVVRIDQQIGQKVTAFYRYVHDTFPEYIGTGTFYGSPIPGLSGTYQNNPGTQHLGKVAWTLTPTTVVDIGYAYSRGQIVTTPAGKIRQSVSPDVHDSLVYPNTSGILSTIAVGGYTSIGGTPVYDDHSLNHQAFGDVTKTFHNHTIIAGVSYDHYNKRENSATGGVQGSFGFTSDSTQPIVTVPTNSSTTGAVSASVAETQSFANFLLGDANNGFSQSNRNPQTDLYQNVIEAYVQDNWKVKPRLTLNLGVRYSYAAQPTDSAGYLNNFDPSTYSDSKAPTISNTGLICTTGTCSQVGSNAGQPTTPNLGADIIGNNYINGLIFGTPTAANNNQASPFGKAVATSQKGNFGPRIGFSYDLFGNGTTALRGGYGIAYDELEVGQWEYTAIGGSYAANPPAVTTYTATQAALDNPSGGVPGGTTFANNTAPGHLYALPLNLKTPYNQQFSLGMQTQFTPSLFFEMAYAGVRGTHLGGDEEINQPRPGAFRGVVDPRYAYYPTLTNCVAPGTTATPILWNSTCERVLNQIKPYKGYYAIDSLETIFNSNYNALQAKLTMRGKGKTYIDANFTWSRDLTNDPSDSIFPEDIYNVNGDYGRASFDRKLILNLDGVYELPWYRDQKGLVGHLVGGWEVSGIIAMNSGLPLTVSTSGAYTVSYNGGYSQPISYATNPQNYGNDNAGLAILGSTNAALRMNQVGNPNNGLGRQLKMGHLYENPASIQFNTGSFYNTDPTSNTPPNARRGTINGPGFIRADVGIFRNFRIYENLNFQLRGEAFNVANHVNVASVQTAATSVYFGEVTGYRDPRILQIAGRFTF
jgi:hypothetical protein